MAPVIDVHTHMLTHEVVSLLEQHGGPTYTLKAVAGGLRAIHLHDAPFMTPVPEMFDYPARLLMMDRVGIDVSVVSLSCPNVYWGGAEVSTQAARLMNDDMAAARERYRGRVEFLCSLPWQHAQQAVAELERAAVRGACGVMVLANIGGAPLTAPEFAPVWQAIDRRGLPVLIHPTAPPGVQAMQMHEFQLTASVGFTFDTSLAVARMLYDGFFDRYPNLKIIASHGGGALPYLMGRLDQCYRNIPACRTKTDHAPSSYMGRLFADSVVFTQQALDLCLHVFGEEQVLFGSDYPHTIGARAAGLLRAAARGAFGAWGGCRGGLSRCRVRCCCRCGGGSVARLQGCALLRLARAEEAGWARLLHVPRAGLWAGPPPLLPQKGPPGFLGCTTVAHHAFACSSGA
ncbi:MAG: amidohydrolase family protein [Rubrivivax sp.]